MISAIRLKNMTKLNTGVINRCVDCKHWLKNNTENNTQDQPLCKMFLSINREWDIYRYEYSYIARSEERLCGRKGKYFTRLS